VCERGVVIMRILNDKEILKAMQEAHPEGEEYPMWKSLTGRLKCEVEAVAKAQYQQDLKDFIAWGDELCDCPKNEFPTQHGHTKRHHCWRCWQSLKQLVEK